MSVLIKVIQKGNYLLINPDHIFRVELVGRKHESKFKVRIFYVIAMEAKQENMRSEGLRFSKGVFNEELTGNAARIFLENYEAITQNSIIDKNEEAAGDHFINFSLAEAFLNDNSINLNDRTRITVMAARLIANSACPELKLNGILEISYPALQALLEFQGALHLNGLTQLPEGAIKFEGCGLYLNGLKSCSLDLLIMAESEFRSGSIYLNGISEIEDRPLSPYPKGKWDRIELLNLSSNNIGGSVKSFLKDSGSQIRTNEEVWRILDR
jgi:hypothetical protein